MHDNASIISENFGPQFGFSHLGHSVHPHSGAYYYSTQQRLDLAGHHVPFPLGAGGIPELHVGAAGNIFPLKPRNHNVKDSMAKRNERERNRVKMVNMAFEKLRQRIPWAESNPKMSKVDTLRAALEYIQSMQDLITECDSQNKQQTPVNISSQNVEKTGSFEQNDHTFRMFDHNLFNAAGDFSLVSYASTAMPQKACFNAMEHSLEFRKNGGTGEEYLAGENEAISEEVDDEGDENNEEDSGDYSSGESSVGYQS